MHPVSDCVPFTVQVGIGYLWRLQQFTGQPRSLRGGRETSCMCIAVSSDQVIGDGVFFRFTASLLLVVIVSMVSVMLEKRTLELRRAVGRQYYQTDLLIEQQVALRLETQRLTAPAQLASLRQHLSSSASGQHGNRRGSTTSSSSGRAPGQVQPLRQANGRVSQLGPSSAVALRATRSRTADSPSSHPDSRADSGAAPSEAGEARSNRLPLLRFQHPFNPKGID